MWTLTTLITCEHLPVWVFISLESYVYEFVFGVKSIVFEYFNSLQSLFIFKVENFNLKFFSLEKRGKRQIFVFFKIFQNSFKILKKYPCTQIEQLISIILIPKQFGNAKIENWKLIPPSLAKKTLLLNNSSCIK